MLRVRSIGKQSGNPGIKAVPIFRDLSISNKMVNIPKCSRNLTGNPRESQSATPSYKKKQRKNYPTKPGSSKFEPDNEYCAHVDIIFTCLRGCYLLVGLLTII